MSDQNESNYYAHIVDNFESFGTTHYGIGTARTRRGANGLELAAIKFMKKSDGIHIYVKIAGRYNVYVKGSDLKGTVESEDKNAYPSNGEKDGYWYISK